MHGYNAPQPTSPSALSIYITNTGSYTLTIGSFAPIEVAADNSDLLDKVKATLPQGWDIAYSGVSATTAELSIYPPSGAGAVTAEVSGDATADVSPYQGAYFEHLPEGSLYLKTYGNDLYILAPKEVESGVIRKAWTKLD